MGSTGKKVTKAVASPMVASLKEAKKATIDKLKPKMPGMPKMPETASALSPEDENVKSVAEAERKRLYSGSGRSGTSLLDSGFSNTKDKDDLLGG